MPLELYLPQVYIDSMLMDSDILGIPLRFENNHEITYQFAYTGTPVGSLVFEASLDNSQWDELPEGTIAVNGTADSGAIYYGDTGMNWNYIRMRFQRTSGSGVLTVKIKIR